MDPALQLIMDQLNKLSAAQEEIKNNVIAGRGKTENSIIAIRSGQIEFEGKKLGTS
jgi:hypothetical protein